MRENEVTSQRRGKKSGGQKGGRREPDRDTGRVKDSDGREKEVTSQRRKGGREESRGEKGHGGWLKHQKRA